MKSRPSSSKGRWKTRGLPYANAQVAVIASTAQDSKHRRISQLLQIWRSRRGIETRKQERHGKLLSRLRERNNSGANGKEGTFTAPAAAFRLDSATTDLSLKGPMESLEDFQYYFTGEREIDVAPKMKGDGRQMATQISRVRQACRQPE